MSTVYNLLNEGGPIFPCVQRHVDEKGVGGDIQWGGLSLRDYFAAKALGGIVAAEDYTMKEVQTPSKGEWRMVISKELTAEFCYQFADAMLAARDRKEGAK